jgi:hypothetical protein
MHKNAALPSSPALNIAKFMSSASDSAQSAYPLAVLTIRARVNGMTVFTAATRLLRSFCQIQPCVISRELEPMRRPLLVAGSGEVQLSRGQPA